MSFACLKPRTYNRGGKKAGDVSNASAKRNVQTGKKERKKEVFSTESTVAETLFFASKLL
jgi:hypothetical protein